MTYAAIDSPAPNTLSASEIAQILGVTTRAIQKRATSEQWDFETISGNGGTVRIYPVSGLPDDIRLAAVERNHPDRLGPEQLLPLKMDDLFPASRDHLRARNIVPERKSAVAMQKARLLRLYTDRMTHAPWGQRQQVRSEFMSAYNSGIAYPDIYKVVGPTSWKTIEGWKSAVKVTGDTMSLADFRGGANRDTDGLSEDVKAVILRCALRPNAPLISEAIRTARCVMSESGIRNGHSDATYRRFIDRWKSTNYDIWVYAREGKKAWNDKVAMYLERDYSLIDVGDIVVADGHVLNFEVINPWTGKPKRMMLVLWYDMKSSYPLGWQIMPTENTAAISAALRWAILRLGKYPKVAYLDNGKAFRAKFFSGCDDFEACGFDGLYRRLGIHTIYAWPYHGQSKTIERFFGTFAELERLAPSYTGTSIEKKPPRMMRGEVIHRKAHLALTGGTAVTLEQAYMAVASWFDAYAERPQRGHLNGQCPREVFDAGRGEGVDPAELRYLMMAQQIKTPGRNGIRMLGSSYYAPQLYGLRRPVEVRYDLQDASCVYVMEPGTGEFICEARPLEKTHPAATILGDEADRERLSEYIRHKKAQEKAASVTTRDFIRDEVMPEHRRQLEMLGLTQKGPAAIDAPAQELLDDDAILAEAAAIETETEPEAEPIILPEVARERDGLDSMREADRYERLVEIEVSGQLVPKQWQAFMTYFEMTPEYRRNIEYYEEHRARAAMMAGAETREETECR